jgi:hypothetical protein
MTITRIIRLKHARASGLDHRDGAGHLRPAYEAGLRARVLAGSGHGAERAFVHATSTANQSAEQSGEEFVMGATSGEEGGAFDLDQISTEERGGPFVLTTGRTEYAYDSDESNPLDGTREPFPRT